MPDWTIGEAEALLRSLKGVLSSRVVARPGGEIEEIHLLTTYEVTPKQTVRNVESALRAHFDLRVDHRKISVAQTTQPGKYGLDEKLDRDAEGAQQVAEAKEAAGHPEAPASPPMPEPRAPEPHQLQAPPAPEVHRPSAPRPETPSPLQVGGLRATSAAAPAPGPASIPVSQLEAASRVQLPPRPAPATQHPPSEPPPDQDEQAGLRSVEFLGHRVEAGRAQRIHVTVAVGWNSERYEGTAATADVSRSRLSAFASATLQAVQKVIRAAQSTGMRVGGELSLDGIREVEALGREFVLVSIHAVEGPGVQTLAGTEVVDDSVERAVILATLQATDRWVRGPS